MSGKRFDGSTRIPLSNPALMRELPEGTRPVTIDVGPQNRTKPLILRGQVAIPSILGRRFP
jgi:hypothetical protein